MALKDWLGPIASGIGSVLGFGGSMYANQQNAAENEKNRQWNEKMWNLSNQYNLPVNMMQRLRDARINPMLAVTDASGTLSSYAGNLGTQRAYENPMKDVNLGDVVRLQNESKIAESQAELNKQQALREEAETDRINADSAYQWNTLEDREALVAAALVKAGWDADAAREMSLKAVHDKNIAYEEWSKLWTYNNQTYSLPSSKGGSSDKAYTRADWETFNLVWQLIKAKGDVALLDEQTKNELERRGLIKAEIKKTESETALNDSQRAYTDALKSKVPAEIAKLRSDASANIALALKYNSDVDLNDYQREKIANDIEEALYNGNVDRVKKILELYGTGNTGWLERALDKLTDSAYGRNYGDRIKAVTRIKKVTVSKRRK